MSMIWTLNGYIFKVSTLNHPDERVFESATYLCQLKKVFEKNYGSVFL